MANTIMRHGLVGTLVLLLCASLLVCSACSGTEKLDPKPFLDSAEWVTTSVHNWLDVRMSSVLFATLMADQTWRNASTLDDYALAMAWLGNMERKIQDFLSSERFPFESEEMLLYLLKQATATYQYFDTY